MTAETKGWPRRLWGIWAATTLALSLLVGAGFLAFSALVGVGSTDLNRLPLGYCQPVPGVDDIEPCEPDAERIVLAGGAFSIPPLETAPVSLARMLDGLGEAFVTHLVVRASYLPNTARCTSGDPLIPPDYLADEIVLMADSKAIRCYIDLRTNEYILGSRDADGGHLAIETVMVLHYSYFDTDIAASLETGTTVADAVEQARQDFEQQVSDAYTGREHIVFLGPPLDMSSQAWQLLGYWDVQREAGSMDTSMASLKVVHPGRDRWREENPTGYETHKATLEMSLAAFDTAVDAAHTARKDANDGRIGPDESLPMLVSAADSLRDYYVEVGAYDEGKPAPAMPPPPCGKAVPDYLDNHGLVLDCKALLAVKDTLRGDATLNWSVDVAMADWDGVRVEGGRVVALNLDNKSLTGTVPARLAELTRLEELRLSGNRLTGCIPPSLRDVAVNDLEDLGLADCA